MADEQTITVVSASGDAAGASVDTPATVEPAPGVSAEVDTTVAEVSVDPAPRVVAATGVAVFGNPTMADLIGDAMREAIQQCLDQGIIDPDTQRERMLAARDAVLNG